MKWKTAIEAGKIRQKENHMEAIKTNATVTSLLTVASAPYQAINCDFHDELEILAMSGESAIIRYFDVLTQTQIEIRSLILDVFSQKGLEFIRINNHVSIRQDMIISVNNKVLKNYC